MARKWLGIDEVQDMLVSAVGNNASAWAAKNEISPQYVSDVINGRRLPGDKITRALGLEKALLWRVSLVRKPVPTLDDAIKETNKEIRKAFEP